jgi:hypothetical protein
MTGSVTNEFDFAFVKSSGELDVMQLASVKTQSNIGSRENFP